MRFQKKLRSRLCWRWARWKSCGCLPTLLSKFPDQPHWKECNGDIPSACLRWSPEREVPRRQQAASSGAAFFLSLAASGKFFWKRGGRKVPEKKFSWGGCGKRLSKRCAAEGEELGSYSAGSFLVTIFRWGGYASGAGGSLPQPFRNGAAVITG